MIKFTKGLMIRFFLLLILNLLGVFAFAKQSNPQDIYIDENIDIAKVNDVEQIKTKYSKEINQIEAFMNNFFSLQANFKQSNQANQIVYGRIFIEKPGKIRCEYLKPSPILIIMNQSKLTYYDKDLDELSYSKFDMGGFRIIANEKISLKNLNIHFFQKADDKIIVGITEYDNKLKYQSKIYFHFTYPEINLEQIDFITPDNSIFIDLHDVVYNQKFPKDLFYFNRIANQSR